MATRYERLAGVSANYLDGTFASIAQQSTDRPNVLLIGTAADGLSHIPFAVNDVNSVADTFGATSKLVEMSSQGVARNANLFVSRVGGKQCHLIIEKSVDGLQEKQTLLRISPVKRAAASQFDNDKLLVTAYTDGDIVRQRVLIFDGNTEVCIFDTEGLLATDEGLYEVEMNNDIDELVYSGSPTVNTAADIKALGQVSASGTNVSALGSLTDYFNEEVPLSAINAIYGTPAALAVESRIILGEAGFDQNPNELFANLETLHPELEYSALDYIYAEGANLDVPDISEFSGVPYSQWMDHYLGRMSRTEIYGKPYLTSFGNQDPLSADHISSATFTALTNNGQSIEVANVASELGLLLSLVDARVDVDNALGQTHSVEVYPKDNGRFGCEITLGTTTPSAMTISTQFFDLLIPDFATANTVATGGTLNLSGAFTSSAVSGSASSAVLTHFDLTGEVVPEEYHESLIDLSADPGVKALPAAELIIREVNFAHQLATMAYNASTEYKTCMAVVGTSEPRGGRQSYGRWAGKAPAYSVAPSGNLVVSKTGTGIMGSKLLFGSSDYRKLGSDSLGIAYGGLMHTNHGFGIDSNDEAKDANNISIDIGKHVIVCGAHGVVTLPNLNRSSQRSAASVAKKVNLGVKLIDRLLELPAYEEPLGPVNGQLNGVTTTRARISRATLNELALGRIAVIDETGAIASLRTAALPSSDYTRVSTVRAVNQTLDAMRSRCMPFLGRSYTDAQIAALDADLAGVMRALKIEGVIQEGVAEIRATQLDRINGRMTIKVDIVPPLSIEAITIDLKLQAPGA